MKKKKKEDANSRKNAEVFLVTKKRKSHKANIHICIYITLFTAHFNTTKKEKICRFDLTVDSSSLVAKLSQQYN